MLLNREALTTPRRWPIRVATTVIATGIVILVLAAFGAVTLGCALLFPDREEELRPELWAAQREPAAVAAE